MPSGPKRSVFRPWWRSRGRSSATTAGFGGLSRLASLLSLRRTGRISPTYSAAAERDAVRQLEVAPHRHRTPASRRHRVHRAGARAHEERAALAQRERARLLEPLGIDADAESGRQPDVLETGPCHARAGDEKSEAGDVLSHLAPCDASKNHSDEKHYRLGLRSCASIHASMRCPSMLSGSGPSSRMASWKARRSKRLPSRFCAFARSSRIASSPIL